jgi:hypothetical protein
MVRLLPFCVLSYQYADDHIWGSGLRIAGTLVGGRSVASYKQELEKRGPEGIPSLDDIEPGKICGAVIPMSERAQTQMRDSIEVIDYLLNQERVVWS